ncbi:zinc-binding dehydrogenase [Nocardioides sp. R-C-SC26]|uniref:zinc-binding dehydrogenase n=1 Tax=Nocardioides sp. R-C-SC26 TaxID=2870414 RepID=UPI001E5498E6|nr:zinc-binding dehydrogenase [Nocardioides sp. R-C-SC26]
MRAVVCQNGDLEVRDVAPPEPGRGQLVLDVLACGICGSDLHARHHADEAGEAIAASGYADFMRGTDAVVLGHEFCGEVVEAGRGARIRPGTRVVAMPIARAHGGVHLTGLTPKLGGGYAEQVLVQQALTFPVPNGLDTDIAAMTEPMAVALHAVRRGAVARGQVAIVIGCGPIGLGVIAMLKAQGVRTVVASDFSPARRALAERMGADVVVDPSLDSPYEVPGARFLDAPGLLELAVGSMEKLRAVPLLPWHHVMRAAERLGAGPSGPVVFECVGVPGMLDGVLEAAPLYSRVVVVGVCMGQDSLRPALGINKEIELRFVLGYTPVEFAETLGLLADGTVDPRPLLTGRVGLDGVAEAFTVLGDPEAHAKIMVRPQQVGGGVSPV